MTINKADNVSATMQLIGFAICIILADGCMPCYYAPNAQNVPVFTEKGQGNGTFSFQLGALSLGWNVQGALAVSDHIGLVANYNHYSGREESITLLGDDYSSHFKSDMGEAGLGYYHTFENKFVFETYGGLGGSRIRTDYERWDGDGSSSIGITSFFIQPAFAYYKKNIRLAFSSRFRLVNYRDIHYSSQLGIGAKESLIAMDQHPSAGFFEPAFTFRAGSEHIKFQTQVGISVILTQSDIFEFDPFNINFGLVFSIHGKKKVEATQ
jgi:hypothetical protein